MDYIREMMNSRKAVYILPFSVLGIYCYHKLQNHNIPVTAFCDGYEAHQGKSYETTVILTREQAVQKDPDAWFVVASVNFGMKIVAQLEELGVPHGNIIPHDSVLFERDIDLLSKQINEEAVLSIMPTHAQVLQDFSLEKEAYFLPSELLDQDSRSLIIDEMVNVCLTERCSLRCRDCNSLMQYFTAPCDLTVQEITTGFEAYLQYVDYVRRVILLGGEPFMHSNFAAVVKAFASYQKIGAKIIITNGTIVPPPATLQAISSSGFRVRISNYGAHSRNIEKLCLALQEYDIPYWIPEVGHWVDCCHIVPAAGRTLSEAAKVFHSCQSYCHSIKGNIFSMCSFASHLGAVAPWAESPCNGVDLTAQDTNRETLQRFLSSKDPIPACFFCSGLNNFDDSSNIPPAIQAKRPLPVPQNK